MADLCSTGGTVHSPTLTLGRVARNVPELTQLFASL